MESRVGDEVMVVGWREDVGVRMGEVDEGGRERG